MASGRKLIDYIHINQLLIKCVIGIYPEELKAEQPVFADVRLGLNVSQAGRSGKISHTCDYERIANEISTLLKFRRYRLLEMAVEEVSAMLFGVHEKIEIVELRLEKPMALRNRAKSAAIEIRRCRQDFPRKKEKASFGDVDVLLETADAGLYLLNIHKGNEIRLHYHEVMRELEWRVSGDIMRNGEKMMGYDAVTWAKKQQHTYKNIGQQCATLFCCDVPAFVPEDEITVT